MRYRWIAAVLLVGGIVVALVSGPAHAAATVTLTISPSSGVTAGQSVTVTASGLTAGSIGNLLECNSDANQPTVALGAPINTKVSVGCTAPSYTKLVTVKSDGTISATYTVLGSTIGPPCGPAAGNIITTCPATDSAGNSPAADAANYPCPPTPAQQAAGDVCQLNYGDAANDMGSGNIGFASSAPPGTTTPPTPATTAGSTPATTSGSTGTTAAPATGSSGSSGSGGSSGANSSASGSSGASGSGASGASSPTAASSSGTLASTGPPSWLWSVLASGLGFLGLGGLLLLDPAFIWRRRTASDDVARVASQTLRNNRNDRWIKSDLWVREP